MSPTVTPPTMDVDLLTQNRPKYEALRMYLVHEIQSGRLKPGESLPTEQALADGLSVARSTVRQTMSVLERDGLIVRIRGKGTFVHDSAKNRLQMGLDLFALVVPETRTGFYPSLLHGFEAASREIQHQAIVCNTENSVDKQASAVLRLIDRGVAGVAMVPTTEPPTPSHHVRQLQKNHIPVVFCHRSVEGVLAPLLALPFERIGRLAGETLLRQGHRRIAILDSQLALGSAEYCTGLRAALQDAGVELDERNLWFGSSPAAVEMEIAGALDILFSRSDCPTAIAVTFDSLAEIVCLQLGSSGKRVPDDVSLISFGGSWRETPMMRRLTSVVVDEEALAFQAVHLLTEMQLGERPLTDSEQFEMPLAISTGQTVGPAP